jgi:hypothetical protein
MARYATTINSQTAQLAGVNATTTVNGYIGYIGGGTSAGYRLRRVSVGVRTTTATVPTSQQISVSLYRQTVAPTATSFASTAGQALETHTPADPTGGAFSFSATNTTFTGAPTIGLQPLHTITFNSQSTVDFPLEFLEELVVNSGTANGLAFVNAGTAALPTGHYLVLSLEWEV